MNRRSFLTKLAGAAASIALSGTLLKDALTATAPIGSVVYDPANYMGEWKWLNCDSADRDGFFYVRFENGWQKCSY
jgi:hypothetical protein